jgi:putative transposase
MNDKRKRIRLRDFDYSSIGAYFITIVIEEHKCLLGKISGEKMHLSRIGEKAQEFWKEIPNHFSTIRLDEFMVMPNNIHGILMIKEKTRVSKDGGVQLNAPTNRKFAQISPRKNTISVIIRTFKGMVTTWCRKHNMDCFGWQCGYYDRVIRNEKELGKIREYIGNNVMGWELDRENPKSKYLALDHDQYWQRIYNHKEVS